MKKILFMIFMAAMLISMVDISMIYIASADNVQNNAQIILRTKYLYYDRYYNGHRIQINITSNVQGNMTYLEEYYVTDQNGDPRLVNSGPLMCDPMCGPFTSNPVSFEIIRPKKENDYSMIKGVVMADGQRIYETWINSSATYKYGVSSSNSTVKRIKPDIQKRTAPFSTPVAQNTDTGQKTVDGKFALITVIATYIVYIFARNKKRN